MLAHSDQIELAVEVLPPAVTPEILRTLSLIAFESGSGTRDLIDGWFLAAGRAIVPVMQLGIIMRQDKIISKGIAEILRLLQREGNVQA